MKTVAIALSAAALFTSAAVSAQESDNFLNEIASVSTKTRAEVKAETLAAIQRGELRDGEQYPNPAVGQPLVQRTRAEVKAELAAYRKTHKEVSDDIVSVQ